MYDEISYPHESSRETPERRATPLLANPFLEHLALLLYYSLEIRLGLERVVLGENVSEG